jgi:glycosyltransferase involved in cell wall biosynthesis
VKVVVDCRYVRVGAPDGISRYTVGLVTALAARHPLTMLVSDHRQLAQLPDQPYAMVSDPTSLREPWVARQVNPLQPDVVFSPMQTMGSWGRRYRLILTVHDLIYYRHPKPPPRFGWPLRLLWRLYHLSWWPQRFLLNRADAVATVSLTTRQLIHDHRLTRRPIAVVPNAAVPLHPTSAEPPEDNSTSRSLVYTGTFMPYKNVDVLARALHQLPGFTLHLISPITEAERVHLEQLAPPGSIICHDGATEEDYHHTLRSALALVSASRDEGFGIPLVEAMSAGIPIVVSDIPIFREVAGSAALFADAADPSMFAAAVRQLTHPDQWRQRSNLGRKQSGRFSWDSSAERLLTLLSETAALPGAR